MEERRGPWLAITQLGRLSCSNLPQAVYEHAVLAERKAV